MSCKIIGFDCWVEGLSTSLSVSPSDLVSIPDISSVWEGLFSSRPEHLIGVELVRGGGGEFESGNQCDQDWCGMNERQWRRVWKRR